MTGIEPIVVPIVLAATGWVASPVVGRLFNDGYTKLGVKANEQVEQLRATVLPLLRSVIEKAEGSAHRCKVEDWLQRLKDAYDDAEDALDLLKYQELKREAAKTKWWPVKGKNGKKEKKLRRCLDKLEEIVNEAKGLDDLLARQPTTEAPPNTETTAEPPLIVFDRTEEVDNFVRLWTGQEPAAIPEPGPAGIPIAEPAAIPERGPASIPLTAIVGRPGVGKTTLAQYICKELKSSEGERHFDLVMWVYASCNFKASEIMKSIIQQACNANHHTITETAAVSNIDDVEVLRQRIDLTLHAKKFLLVIDDVWCEREDDVNNWKILRCLNNRLPGNRILVTSQMNGAPRKIGHAIGATIENIYCLKELEDNDFFDLFIHHALPSGEIDSRERFEEIGTNIAQNLNKDPKTAEKVGDYLRDNLEVRYWRDTEQKDWADHKTKAHMQSYQHLPAYLQRCFSYLTLYPKGHEFNELEVLQFWMAQGFIKPAKQNETMEDAGSRYLKELVSRFYIQQHDSYYTLDEVLYDLAKSISRYDCLRIEGNHQTEIPSTIRHLYIPANRLNELKEGICKLTKLRTLIVTGGESVTLEERVATDIFKSLKKLRVLVLELNPENLAKLIGKMKHLCILQVADTSKFALPKSVCTLYQLQALRIKNARLLPECLNNFIRLKYLELSTIPDIGLIFVTKEDLQMRPEEKRSIREVMRERTPEWFPHQYRESLVNNEIEMRNFIVTMNGSNNEASTPEHASIPADLGIAAVWERWLQLHEKKMQLIYDKKKRAKLLLPSTLTRLRLKGCNITSHALLVCLQNLTSLTELSLEDIRTITCLPSVEVLGELKALEHLSLIDCWTLTSLGGIGSLPGLENLNLNGCPCLNSATAFLPPSMKIAQFVRCPDVDGILANKNLPGLSRLCIDDCFMPLQQPTSLQLGNLQSLHSLEICSMPNLQVLMNLTGSLKRFKIQQCPLLEEQFVFDPLQGKHMLYGIPVDLM